MCWKRIILLYLRRHTHTHTRAATIIGVERLSHSLWVFVFVCVYKQKYRQQRGRAANSVARPYVIIIIIKERLSLVVESCRASLDWLTRNQLQWFKSCSVSFSFLFVSLFLQVPITPQLFPLDTYNTIEHPARVLDHHQQKNNLLYYRSLTIIHMCLLCVRQHTLYTSDNFYTPGRRVFLYRFSFSVYIFLFSSIQSSLYNKLPPHWIETIADQ